MLFMAHVRANAVGVMAVVYVYADDSWPNTAPINSLRILTTCVTLPHKNQKYIFSILSKNTFFCQTSNVYVDLF